MNILIADTKYNLKRHICKEIAGLNISSVLSKKINTHIIKRMDLIIVNADLTDVENSLIGLDLIKNIRLNNPSIEIIALLKSPCPFKMEQSLNYGASKILIMPESFKELIKVIKKKICFKNLIRLTKNSNKIPWAGSGTCGLNILKKISLLKNEPGPILIEGPTGTGKEVVIKLIEFMEAPKKIIKVNVAAITSTLFESEFFGHVKGAFTGADKNKAGLVEQAKDNILFLDEIEALPANLQVKLLRFLESGEVKPVGSDTSHKIDCKLIFATNKNLEELVDQNYFREDLLWRISGKKVSLPCLSNRKEELKEIFEYYLKKISKRVYTLSDCGLNQIKNYGWPGNIRELIRVCEQLVIAAPLPIIRRVDLLPYLKTKNTSAANNTYSSMIRNFESGLIKNYYFQHNKNVEATCKALDVSRSNLYKKLKEYQIN